jgi:hypothetical protein
LPSASTRSTSSRRSKRRALFFGAGLTLRGQQEQGKAEQARLKGDSRMGPGSHHRVLASKMEVSRICSFKDMPTKPITLDQAGNRTFQQNQFKVGLQYQSALSFLI